MGASCSANHSDLAVQRYGGVPNFKIVLVGDPEVGKTSVFMRYFKNQFDYSYRTTTSVNIENVVKKVNIPEHLVVSVTIWDLPGREEVDLRKSYYKDVDAAIVVVNIADKESIELAGTWRQDIHNHAVVSKKQVVHDGKVSKVEVDYVKADPTQLPVLLLGNKYDIIEEREALQQAKSEEENSKSKENGTKEKANSNLIKHQPKIGENKKQLKDRIKNEKKDEEKENHSGIDFPMKQEGEEERGKAKAKEEVGQGGRENDVTVWKYEEEHEPEIELPVEVELLEIAAEQHGFVGSVAVSAKDSDGGVHIAIQALIRHLLERKLKDKALEKMEAVQVRRIQKKRMIKKSNPDDFKPLDKCGIEEIDRLFVQTNSSLNKIHETSLAFRQAVRQFKRVCLQRGIVEGQKCSIEDCIGGLKAALAEQNLDLMTQDTDGFLELAVQGEIIYEEQKSEDVKMIIDTFQSEVVVACQAILMDDPTADADLVRMDAKIADECAQMWTLAERSGPLSAPERKQIRDKVDFNRARIKQAHLKAVQNLQDVEGLYKKIKAALLW